MKSWHLLISFYKSYIFLSGIFTLLSAYTLFLYGPPSYAIIFWFKLLTTGIIIYYISNYKKSDFYYYMNFGLSKLHLWSSTLAFDFLICFVALLITETYR